MKRSTFLAVLILGITAGLFLFGCSGPAVNQWAAQRQSLSNFEKTLTPAVASGKLTPKEIDLANNGILAMRAALADAGHVDTNGKFIQNNAGGFKGDIDIAKAVAKRLADTYLAAPATQPSR